MRIYHDPIKFQDWYRVVRKGNNVCVRWVADGNTTFPWPSPEKDGYLVFGPACYEGNQKGACWDLTIIDMVLCAIQQAKGLEYGPGPWFDTLAQERAEKRAIIQDNLRWIPELEMTSDA